MNTFQDRLNLLDAIQDGLAALIEDRYTDSTTLALLEAARRYFEADHAFLVHLDSVRHVQICRLAASIENPSFPLPVGAILPLNEDAPWFRTISTKGWILIDDPTNIPEASRNAEWTKFDLALETIAIIAIRPPSGLCAAFCVAFGTRQGDRIRQGLPVMRTLARLFETVHVRRNEQGRIDTLVADLQAGRVAANAMRDQVVESARDAHDAREEMRNALAAVQIPLALYDLSGAPMRANPATCRLAGDLAREQFLARPCAETICGLAGRPESACPVLQVLRTRQPAAVERPVKGRICKICAVPVLADDGSLLNVLESIVDIHDAVEGRRQQEKALEAARAADRAKSAFIANMSHEIRTPLNTIIGFIDLLKDEGLPEETRAEYLDAISFSSKTLLGIINDVLDLSKLEADRMPIVPEPTDVADLCRQVLRIFAFKAEEKGLALEADLAVLPPLEIDPARVRQMLLNLIGNAVKFTPAGSVVLRARYRPEGRLVLSVTDTGIGISKQDQSRLMQPFVQLARDHGISRDGNAGTGLGLAITRRLAEKMDGSLSVRSVPGRGATFTIDLPARPPRSGALAQAAPEAPDGPALRHPERIAVLLVDDVRLNLQVLAAICRKIGIQDIVCASSGEKALAELRRRPFDLVLTDLWMPGMSGAGLCDAIRSDPAIAHLPVVAVTADIEAKSSFPDAAFSGLLLKPIGIQALESLLATL